MTKAEIRIPTSALLTPAHNSPEPQPLDSVDIILDDKLEHDEVRLRIHGTTVAIIKLNPPRRA